MITGGERAERERLLAAELAVEYPDWDIERVPGLGFEARPKGTQVLHSITIDGLKAKLEKHAERKAPEP
jgi:hypothetical protein